jgi:hypothetical protein
MPYDVSNSAPVYSFTGSTFTAETSDFEEDFKFPDAVQIRALKEESIKLVKAMTLYMSKESKQVRKTLHSSSSWPAENSE